MYLCVLAWVQCLVHTGLLEVPVVRVEELVREQSQEFLKETSCIDTIFNIALRVNEDDAPLTPGVEVLSILNKGIEGIIKHMLTTHPEHSLARSVVLRVLPGLDLLEDVFEHFGPDLERIHMWQIGDQGLAEIQMGCL